MDINEDKLKHVPMEYRCIGGRIYNPYGVLVSNPAIYYPTLESWESTKKAENKIINKTNNKMADPKDHKVKVELSVSANDYDKIMSGDLSKLTKKECDMLELKREIAIMREVNQFPGNSITEKADNAIEAWSKSTVDVPAPVEITRYKFKHKH